MITKKCKNPHCNNDFEVVRIAKSYDDCCIIFGSNNKKFCCSQCSNDYHTERVKDLKVIEPVIREYWKRKESE